MTQSDTTAHFPSVGRWSVTAMPAGWIYTAGFGIRQMPTSSGMVCASVGLGQDALDAPGSLAEYVEKQKKLIGGHLKEAKFAGPQSTAFAGAEEAQLVFVRHIAGQDKSMLHAQTYLRIKEWVGIVTLTALESELKAVRPDYEIFVKGLHISPEQNASRG